MVIQNEENVVYMGLSAMTNEAIQSGYFYIPYIHKMTLTTGARALGIRIMLVKRRVDESNR